MSSVQVAVSDGWLARSRQEQDGGVADSSTACVWEILYM